MRNVPVGAGRRKNKNSSASQYRQIMVPKTLQIAKDESANGLYNRAAVLTFGSDSPLCDSMVSVLNLAEKTQNGVVNGFHLRDRNNFVDNENDQSVGASGTASTCTERKGNATLLEPVNNIRPGFSWPCQWNSSQWSSSIPQGYPASFCPNAIYWGCTLPASWNIPSISAQSSSVNQSTPSSPSLGKHSREGNIINPVNSPKENPNVESGSSENSVLIPKTLRVGDPSEAAKSSIWSALGMKNENEGGFFRAFPAKKDDKKHMVEPSLVLQANPAALSRSRTFHEQI